LIPLKPFFKLFSGLGFSFKVNPKMRSFGMKTSDSKLSRIRLNRVSFLIGAIVDGLYSSEMPARTNYYDIPSPKT
jgi:hypothetical protein